MQLLQSQKKNNAEKIRYFKNIFFSFLIFLSQLQKFSLQLQRSAINLIFHLIVTL